MSTAKTLLTADDLLRLSAKERGKKRLELVRGELIEMPPAGSVHGRVAGNIGRHLSNFIAANNRGVFFAAETGFLIARHPDTVRAPDASFIAKERLPASEPEGFSPTVPDLVVEVVSPGDTATEVQVTIHEWLAAGVRLVWVLPENQDSRRLRVIAGRETPHYG